MRSLLVIFFCMLVVCCQAVERVKKDSWIGAREANNAFALDLFRHLSQNHDNVLVSPYSISAALGMTYIGAKDTTADQMKQVLHIATDPQSYAVTLSALNEMMNAKAGDQPFDLSSANAVWLSDRMSILDSYKNALKAFGGIHTANYGKPEAVRVQINKWVEEKTHDRIKDLLPQGSLTQDTLLTLVNALYLKAPWAVPFRAPVKGNFYLDNETAVQADMVRKTGRYAIEQTPSYDVVELPYEKGRAETPELVMRIYLPHEYDGLDRLKESLPIKGGFVGTVKSVDVTIPKCHIEGGVQLKDVLQSMGMNLAFSDRANFTGISDDKPGPKIGEVYHKTFIEVDENGTEAVAATAVVMVARSAVISREEPVVFRADHPFLFTIVEKKTGTILFVGQLTRV